MSDTVCIKIGGSTVDAPGLLAELAAGIKQLLDDGHFPIVVHGGGKDIARQLNALNKEFTFVEGLRVTDRETMHTVQMVLSGEVNKRIVNALLLEGLMAVGISGVDGGLFEAEKKTVNGQDIGFVGTIKKVQTNVVEFFIRDRMVPVVSPVSRDKHGEIYNVNADSAAGELAKAIRANHLYFISDVPGVLVEDNVRHDIPRADIDGLVADGHVTGGMIPKLRGAAEAVECGVGNVHICGWHGPRTLMEELEPTTATGTVIH